jgi:hypothetical protein
MTRSVTQLVAWHEGKTCGLHEEVGRLFIQLVLKEVIQVRRQHALAFVFDAVSCELEVWARVWEIS